MPPEPLQQIAEKDMVARARGRGLGGGNEPAGLGNAEFDFLGALDDWKAHWTSQVRPHRLWHVFHEGVWGRTLHAVRFGMRRAVKVLLGRAESGR